MLSTGKGDVVARVRLREVWRNLLGAPEESQPIAIADVKEIVLGATQVTRDDTRKRIRQRKLKRNNRREAHHLRIEKGGLDHITAEKARKMVSSKPLQHQLVVHHSKIDHLILRESEKPRLNVP